MPPCKKNDFFSGNAMRQSEFSKMANLFAGVQGTLPCCGVGGRGALLFFAFAAAVHPMTDDRRRSESRRSCEVVFRERPELSNLPFRQILVLDRVEPLRAGDFVLCTTSLLGWTAAILGVLHDTFLRDGKCSLMQCLDFRNAALLTTVDDVKSTRLERHFFDYR